ncbi:MAG TPA: flagellar hook-associated protein FlgK, partial [Chroococcales cyanobacterium]
MSFFGFSIANSGLMTSQRAIETLSHNIANANTPGYSRQTTTIIASTPIQMGGKVGMLGTGATTASIDRQRNAFLDLQYRNENTKLGEHDMVSKTISQVEGVFGEPSDSGLRMMTERFWTSLHDLSLNPESIAARGSVSETGAALANSLNAVQKNLKGVRDDLNMRINNEVTDANILAKQIAGLNSQISNITTLGQQPNDLKDQRDLALDKLSRMMDIKVKEGNDGSIKVTVAGRVLVEGSVAVELSTQQNGEGNGYVDILASGVTIRSGEIKGELKGLLDLRDGILSDKDPNSV